ncbi:6-phosphogluconate dehydrogenase [Enterococcus canis]|uniref:6-phosphogluconate dehydrogenase n=1 Tax=Enterococcus canis TaxID=214095 RepID=A0A1L8RD38_9ENTE|nr:decarboxylating 6-phosphogluconate dehydrogenase [Enterococcus canis]OJG17681.1 6-phosphogluconate dehydrogenase [Enterococcus canis]
MEIGIVGLGKMGMNLAFNLKDHGYDVKGLDLSEAALAAAKKEGVATFTNLEELTASFNGRRIIWLMLPAGEPTEKVLEQLLPLLSAKDIVVEGGNSNYKDSVRRANTFAEADISYFDCGTSGGISGARNDACLMIGGDKEVFASIEQLFKDIAIENGYLYAGASGSGHFLKMVHNGIEYGMMQAIGEGFQVVEQSNYDFDLAEVARVWNHGSVVRSWLMEIAEAQFRQSPKLADYRGVVAASGEAKWTVETALEMDVPVPTIALSLFMRNLSQEDDSFSAKVVSALRNGFGGHEIVKK